MIQRGRKEQAVGYARELQLPYAWAMDNHASTLQTELAGITIAAKDITRRQISGEKLRGVQRQQESPEI
ncbi:hypothetical protein NQ318_017678 [Aromia moschata]|uniref:Uncharacterized protein n=1 Tax=Aromia moschata TaxID=1265417 RepID=A0AAV8X8L0_9CUCU|nr:hypothetical protein NQ318_017678 [Aromia moschata]